METCKTVRVVAENDEGYKVINASDMTDDHELYGDDAAVSGSDKYASMSKKDLAAVLTERGVEVDAKANKAALVAACEASDSKE